MANWYLVRNGLIVTRYGDRLPPHFTDPSTEQVIETTGKSPEEIAVLGLLEGVATEPMAFDSATQKSFVRPVVPETLQQYLGDWKVARDAGKPLPIPTVLEEWVVEALTEDELAQIRNQALREVRWTRDHELMRTDRFMLLDSPAASDPAQLKAWRQYRQALRDLPAAIDDPADVAWPVAPDAQAA